MKKAILVLFIVFGIGIVGCTKDEVKKNLKGLIESAATPAIAVALECSNPDAIGADVKAKLDAILPTDKGFFSDLCKSTVKNLFKALVTDKIPAAWECKAETAVGTLDGLVDSVCNQIKSEQEASTK